VTKKLDEKFQSPKAVNVSETGIALNRGPPVSVAFPLDEKAAQTASASSNFLLGPGPFNENSLVASAALNFFLLRPARLMHLRRRRRPSPI
jgi:hypothetical protein